MQQIVEYYKLKSKVIVFTAILLFIAGCKPSVPSESSLEIGLKEQVTETPFSFKDYCEKEYGEICVIHPYFNTNKKEFLDLKMSDELRSLCNINTGFESKSTILFINKKKVEAYSIIKRIDADFASSDIEKQQFFPFKQRFILDEKRGVCICNE